MTDELPVITSVNWTGRENYHTSDSVQDKQNFNNPNINMCQMSDSPLFRTCDCGLMFRWTSCREIKLELKLCCSTSNLISGQGYSSCLEVPF